MKYEHIRLGSEDSDQVLKENKKEVEVEHRKIALNY